jgi:hypothetical protein
MRARAPITASVVHVNVRHAPRLHVVLEPGWKIPMTLRFSHDADTASTLGPRYLVWEVRGLRPGEKVEIRLHPLPAFDLAPTRADVSPTRIRKGLFPSAWKLPSGYFGWVIPYGHDLVESGPAHSPAGRFRLERPLPYDIVFTDEAGVVIRSTLEIDVLPDP